MLLSAAAVRYLPVYLDEYIPTCDYYFCMSQKSGWYETAGLAVTSETEDRVDVAWKLRWVPDGDINKDSIFDAGDAELLKAWLHGNAPKMMNTTIYLEQTLIGVENRPFSL